MKPQQHRSAARQTAVEALVFALGAEEYGVDILKVQEIRGCDKVVPIPRAPAFLKGVMNLRGMVVPVVDLRVKFALPEARYDEFTVMVLLRVSGRIVGLVVDGVSDVIALTADEIKPAPTLGSIVDGSFIAGVATPGERMVLLLDIERLLSTGDLAILAEATADAREAG